jgi:uncharacterized membrane protein
MTKASKRELATSLTTFTFLVIGMSGVMMFFHFFDDYVKELHEILGLFFVLVILFHVFYNFKSMKNYFTKKMFGFSALAITIVSLVFILNTPDGQNPKRAIIMSMLDANLESSVMILNKDIVDVKSRLELKGITIQESDTIKSVAQNNKMSPFELVGIILE